MQQRGANATAEMESEEHASPPQNRGRNNSKLKLLVRSHAMREEASPPRDPPQTNLISPCIKLIPSPTSSSPCCSPTPASSKPVVVLSPSISRGNSPCRSPICTSPTSTLIASPASKTSPQSISPHSISPHSIDNADNARFHVCNHHVECTETGYVERSSPKLCNNMISKQNQDKLHCGLEICEGKCMSKGDIITEETSHMYCGSRKKSDNKYICECVNQNCIKCSKLQERNINNNISSNINNNIVGSPNTLTVSRSNLRGKLQQQNSSQGSFEGSSSNSPCLSRDSSSEQYTDTTGVDLDQFIAETLNRNAKDRALMLRIERELVSLAKDKIKTHYKFPPMSSYQRMLVHRCAAYFGMDHNIESSGKCVVVNKTKNTRIPDVEFKEHIKDDIVFMEEPRRSILKRDSNSIEDYSYKSPDRQLSLENRRSKSFEEREEEYEKARRRIFNREMHEFGSVEDFGWSEVPWSSTDSDNSFRFRVLPPERSLGRLLKGQSVEAGSETTRPCVAKSYSFGGYGGCAVLSRGDSVMSTHSAGPRLLTKQDSGASTVSWRLSPSSSGYKSQSQISESVTPSPTSTPNPSGESTRQDSTNSNTSMGDIPLTQQDNTDAQLVWAVTDIHSIPKGSNIINPQTGQYVTNCDGTLYHYDPLNPPPGFTPSVNTKPPLSPVKIVPQKFTKEIISPKKRSRSSPCSKRSNLTNSSTSPSLPFAPPLQPGRNIQFMQVQSNDNITNLPVQQYPVFGGNYGPVPAQDASVQLYQQPCIVYGSYGAPMQPHFEGRLDPQMQEIPGGYYVQMNMADNPGNPPATYQTTPSYWGGQQLTFYQNPPPPNLPPPPPRFPMPNPGQPGPFMSPTYPPNYVPQSTQAVQNVPQAPPNPEIIPLYSHQPVQMMYSAQPNQQMYPGQGVIYTQNPVYPNVMVPLQNMPYPPASSTPNNCASSIPNTIYGGPLQESAPLIPQNMNPNNFGQLTHSMSQLGICSGQMNYHPSHSNPSQTNLNFSQNIGNAMPQIKQVYDTRVGKNNTAKGNKFSTPKNFVSCSSQSSTGTSSPATTVVAGYCNNQGAIMYRTPPETPPTHNIAFGYGPNFPPMLLRQVSNIRASPPITNRSSRSPTPASDISHMDRHRFSLPPTLYQGMPYVLQADSRIIPGRGQPNTYRQPPLRPQSFNHGNDNTNKSHKNRKSNSNVN